MSTAPAATSLFLATFTSIFLAELGDKTQLATLALSGATDSASRRWVVFAGAACALVLSSGIGVLLGAGVGRYLSVATLNRIAGVAFVAMGAWMLWRGR